MLLSRIFRWLSRLLDNIFARRLGSRFDWLQGLIYVLVAAALILLAGMDHYAACAGREKNCRSGDCPFFLLQPRAGVAGWLRPVRWLKNKIGAMPSIWPTGRGFLTWKKAAHGSPIVRGRPGVSASSRPRAAHYPALAALTRKFEISGMATALPVNRISRKPWASLRG